MFSIHALVENLAMCLLPGSHIYIILRLNLNFLSDKDSETTEKCESEKYSVIIKTLKFVSEQTVTYFLAFIQNVILSVSIIKRS